MHSSAVRRRFLTGSSIAAALLASAQPAFAQTSDVAAPAADDVVEDSQDIIVTGSLIGRSDLNSAAPISVIGEQQLMESGSLSVSEVLKQDPSVGVNSRGNAFTLNGAGASNVNLRNLGNRRTLALVNGRRIPLFSDAIGTAGQDTTIIPTNLLQRVDILRDGASATYGADAVAGVVNFILRDRFEGLQTEAFYGQTGRGDGEAWRVSALAGFNFDRGSIVLSGMYSDTNPIKMSDRKWSHPWVNTLAIPFSANTLASNSTPGGWVFGPGSTTLPPIACYGFNVPGQVNNPLNPACPRYDSSYETSLTMGLKVRSLGALIRYDLTDDIRFVADVFQTRRRSFSQISAVQIDTSGLTGIYPGGFTIPRTNSNNPYGTDVRLRWRPVQYGSRPTTGTSNLFFANVGFEGSIFDRFNWSVTHSYGVSDATARTPNAVDSVALFNLLNPTNCAATPTCAAVGAIPNIADLLTGARPLSTAQQGYLFFDQVSDNRFSSAQTIATINGPLFKLPGGEARAAIGFEHRRETGVVIPDEQTQAGVAIGSFVFPTDGKFTTKEVFGELDLPILADVAGFHELTLNLQGRYSDFSNFGSAKVYKIGLNYAPVDGIRFRGAYGTSFRAPDVLELYGGGVGSTGSIVDPCNASGQRATNAQVAANCNTLGVPANFFQIANALPTRSGGNPALQPERGRTFTAGVVLSPAFLPQFTATIDYYDIRVRDAIGAGNVQANINACYADAALIARSQDPNDICFSFGNRQANGSLDRILTRSVNIAQQSTRGVDININLSDIEVPFLPGSFRQELRLSHIASFKQQGLELAGTFNGGVDGSQGYPRWRGNLTTTYSLDNFDAELQINYVHSIRDQNVGASIPTVNLYNYKGVPTYATADFLVRYRPTETMRITAGVNNLFDRDPPYAFVLTRNALSAIHDQVGRYFYASIQQKF